MPEAAVAERTLPHNLEAERSVLGAILLHNDAFNLAAEVIDSSDIFRDAHRRIFDKMVKLAERRRHRPRHAERGARAINDLDEVGGPAYISALIDGVPRHTNRHAKIVKGLPESDLLREQDSGDGTGGG
jgi:replicative DNA helicase